MQRSHKVEASKPHIFWITVSMFNCCISEWIRNKEQNTNYSCKHQLSKQSSSLSTVWCQKWEGNEHHQPSPYALIYTILHWTATKMPSLYANYPTTSKTKHPRHGKQFANTKGIWTALWHVWPEIAQISMSGDDNGVCCLPFHWQWTADNLQG